MSLNKLSEEIFMDNNAKGFWPISPRDRNVGEALMLIVSELGEAIEAHRKGRFSTAEEFNNSLNSSGKNHIDSLYSYNFESYIKDSFEDEMADAVIRILDFCGGFGIDIENHVKWKLDYNKTREKLHGKKY